MIAPRKMVTTKWSLNGIQITHSDQDAFAMLMKGSERVAFNAKDLRDLSDILREVVDHMVCR